MALADWAGRFTYLLLDAGSVLFPLLLSFDKKVAFWRQWRALWPAVLAVASVFIAWDAVFTHMGIWGFNERYILGPHLLGLPLEELMFFFCVPYACVFVYACIKSYFGARLWPQQGRVAGLAVALLFLLQAAFFYDRWYSLTAFGGAGILLLLAAWQRLPWIGTFMISYAICLLPFFIVNGFLTSIPVVIYNDLENMGVRLGTVPAEDTAYCLLMLLGTVWLFERRLPLQGE